MLAALAALSLVAVLGWSPQHVRAAVGELFFSEYVEGSGANQALEIYNPGDVSIDLGAAGYAVAIYADGSASPRSYFLLSGVLGPHDVHVVVNAAAGAAVIALADQTIGQPWFDGNDAVILIHTATVIDRIGQVAFDPGIAWTAGGVSTTDSTLRRDPSVSSGDLDALAPFDPSIEWQAYAVDDFSNLGFYGSPPDLPPATLDDLQALVNSYVSAGQLDASKASLFHDRLDRAARFLDAGQTDAYRSQLIALGVQAQDLAPRWLTDAVADAVQQAAEQLAAG